QTLISRAVESLSDVEHVYDWEFTLIVAQYGSPKDIAQTRKFLVNRLAFPSSEIARATLTLFDAFTCQPEKAATKHKYALDAFRRFTTLGLYNLADIAKTLLPEISYVTSPVAE